MYFKIAEVAGDEKNWDIWLKYNNQAVKFYKWK